MTRHAKNCTAGTVYTYHERKKDTKKSGYGSKAVRFGKDSVKDFDCCSLTLQPCRDPVITPDGYMYDREAILECLLHQKTEAARKMKAYEKQKKKQQAEEAGKMEEKERSKVESFVSLEKRITTKPKSTFTVSKEKSATGDSVQMVDEMPSTSTGSSNSESKGKNLPSFWVPSLTPQAEPTLLKKPDTKTFCPMSGKPLRIKDLIPVKLTPIDDRDGRPMVAKSERYKCAVTHDTLGNSVPCAVLKNTGHVVTMDCIEKLIRKDMLCPFTGSQLKDSDIIPLQRGGTGFAGSGVHLEAKKAGPVLQA